MAERSQALIDLLHSQPWRDIIEGIDKAQHAIYAHTARKGIREIVFDAETALALGLAPGTSMDVNTSAGAIRIRAEHSPFSRYLESVALLGR
jgi:hypothetical protein